MFGIQKFRGQNEAAVNINLYESSLSAELKDFFGLVLQIAHDTIVYSVALEFRVCVSVFLV